MSGKNLVITNPSGNKIFYSNQLLATAENSKQKTSVYPNPASDELFVKNENNIELSAIKITDLTGKIVLNQNAALNSINISNLSKGMYFVTIETQTGNTVTSKIIKE